MQPRWHIDTPHVSHKWEARVLFEETTKTLFCGELFTHAEQITGKVIHVADGDTLTLLDPDKLQHRIRIAGIDASEKAQPFGNRSRQNLQAMAHGQEAIADCPKTDRYGRKVCMVWVWVWVQPSDCPA